MNSKTYRQVVGSIKADFSLEWGVRDENYEGHLMCAPLVSKRLVDLSSDHLENIIVSQGQITPTYKRTILEILKRRNLMK